MPLRRRARQRPRYRSSRGARPSPEQGRRAARRAWSPARLRSSWNEKSLTGNGLGRLRNEFLEARPHLFGESLDALVVERLREPDDEPLDPGLPMRADLLRDLVGPADDRARWRGHPVVLSDARELCLRLGLVVANDDPAPADRFDLRRITTDILAMLPQDRDLPRHDLGALERVPHVRIPRRGAERALLAGAADQDR